VRKRFGVVPAGLESRLDVLVCPFIDAVMVRRTGIGFAGLSVAYSFHQQLLALET